MNLLYLSFADKGKKSNFGVIKKIEGQVKAFNNNNIKCYYTYVDNNGFNFRYLETDLETYNYSNLLKPTISKRVIFYKNILNFIRKKNINAIYIRYYLSDPFFISFLRKCKKYRLKIIIEIPTYPYMNEPINKVLYRLDQYYSKKLNKYVDYIVTFSKHKSIFDIDTISIENAVDVESIKLSESKNDNVINLIGVANLKFWHGYDRVIDGLINYYKSDHNKCNKKVIFTVIGEGSELQNLLKKVSDNNLQDYVIFKGALAGNELDLEFDKADIAVSSIGVHRLRLEGMSTLKSKEYWARGIPFIKSYPDRQIDSTIGDYIFNVESNDDPVDIIEVVEFHNRINKNLHEVKTNMRRLAEKSITWEIQLKPVINKIRKFENNIEY